MDRQGTWEILLLPTGIEAGKGIASINPDPGPSPACTAAGAPDADTNSDRHPWNRLAKTISRRTCEGRKS